MKFVRDSKSKLTWGVESAKTDRITTCIPLRIVGHWMVNQIWQAYVLYDVLTRRLINYMLEVLHIITNYCIVYYTSKYIWIFLRNNGCPLCNQVEDRKHSKWIPSRCLLYMYTNYNNNSIESQFDNQGRNRHFMSFSHHKGDGILR